MKTPRTQSALVLARQLTWECLEYAVSLPDLTEIVKSAYSAYYKLCGLTCYQYGGKRYVIATLTPESRLTLVQDYLRDTVETINDKPEHKQALQDLICFFEAYGQDYISSLTAPSEVLDLSNFKTSEYIRENFRKLLVLLDYVTVDNVSELQEYLMWLNVNHGGYYYHRAGYGVEEARRKAILTELRQYNDAFNIILKDKADELGVDLPLLG